LRLCSTHARVCSQAKLEHDAGQIARLLASGELPSAFWPVLTNYTLALAELQRRHNNESNLRRERGVSEVFNTAAPAIVSPDLFEMLAPWYNTHLWSPPTPRLPGGALSSSLDGAAAEEEYQRGQDPVVLDGVLSDEALASLVRFARDATVCVPHRPHSSSVSPCLRTRLMLWHHVVLRRA